ncbi:MAG: efflux RND transporter periplasmic adaptor subunit [Verrucomicrobiae bacterium]|nr:efflux RND transporter periplasmic adaptor subunit [Verrucomicrobiae bacterium]
MKTSRSLFTLLLATATTLSLATVGCRRADAPPSASDVPAAGKSVEPVEYWTCSMHPQVREPKPGRCPFCGMNLTPVRAASKDTAGSAAPVEVRLEAEAIRQAGVQVEPVQRRRLSREVTVFGTLGYDLNRHHDVVSLVEGRVERFRIDINQTEVAKDAPLADLYSVEALGFQEDYLKSLRERWLSTFYERDLLASMVALAREKLRRIGFTDEDLVRLEKERKPRPEVVVRAPIAGTLVDNMVRLGEIVRAGQTLYHLAPLDEIWFNAQVFESDLGALHLGQRVRVTTKAEPGREHTGKLVFLGRMLNENNRTVPARFVLPNPDRTLLPNLSASGVVEILVGDAVLSVPNSAVLDLGTRHVVYLEEQDGMFTPREIRAGQVTPHYTEIVSGLTEGEPVVVAGAFLVDAQAQLRAGAGEGMSGMPGMKDMGIHDKATLTTNSPPEMAAPHPHTP